jgi:hypothetical protein
MSTEAGEGGDEEVSKRWGLELVDLGAETVGSVVGAGAGLVFGPPGVILGAVAGPALVRMVVWAGREVKSRLLSPREEERIGTALYVALGRIAEREAEGEEPREDGLFDPDQDPRGVLEGSLLAAAKSYDALKVPYIGAFYASFVFEEGVGVDEAHFLLTLWDRLTYHQLVVLAYLADPGFDEERERIQAEGEEEGTAMSEMLATELSELTALGLIGTRTTDGDITAFGGTVGTLGGGAATLSKNIGLLAPMRLGETLVRMAELDRIPVAEKRAISAQLSNDGRRSGTDRRLVD